MIWFVLGITAVIIAVSVVYGMARSRRPRGRTLTNDEKMNLAKASGGLPNRKEN